MSTDDELSQRVAELIDPETGRITASRLAAAAGLSTQSIYNTRDRVQQKPETLDAIRRAIETVESGTPIARPPREARSVRIPIGRGVWVVVEDGADRDALARILRMDEENRPG